ncbi:SubName: Full=Related to acid phosphatase {ECO:0000313/EMBL:CCA72173.1} [Serendipita indica DSM 11827]|uniref:Related to acid phosphatase n=1 Tax=Serendipita indica (strain DSM 11827) TaxID=1109443 RepID=G4TLI0_SERID|nr:SubName: Full=Related to acid phosphatase {ECO:0000313/EMBL:CCA72173.1} [Serendipita indica DSM 11827]CCA72173.1 related to acid phosphatase precursor [Serendipita indica DSM 11827]
MNTFVSFLALTCVANAAVLPRDSLKIVIGNDDGWATANIRTFYNTLKGAGYNPLISAPASNKSGSSGIEFPPIPLITAGEFNTIPAGAPATGADPKDKNIYYVNSFPATAMKYGIEEFAPKVFGGKPDFAVTGVNVGDNLGLKTQFSGTVGAAAKAISYGIPAIAFSGVGGTQHVYTEADPVADVYAQVATKLVNAVIQSGAPYLPAGVGLNVNIPDAKDCPNASDYKFVLSRINTDINPLTDDVNQCSTNHLPTESAVIDAGGCRVPVSVFKGTTKLDVDKDTQKQVRDRLAGLLTCL